MKSSWRLAALKNGFQDATAYRAEFLMDVVGSAIVPGMIQLILWYAMFSIGGATTVAGMNYHQMIQYTIVSMLFNQVRGGDLDFELHEMIRTGQLSNYLLRPVGVVEFVYIRGSAPRFFVAGINLVIGLLLGLYFEMTPARMLGAMALAIIGNVIHYQIGAALAAAAFRWENSYSILMVKNLAVSLLCGELIPLNFFPPSTQWIWKITPFYLYVFGPTQYALGNWSHSEFILQVGIALGWVFAAWIGIRISWRIGIKNYASLGG